MCAIYITLKKSFWALKKSRVYSLIAVSVAKIVSLR